MTVGLIRVRGAGPALVVGALLLATAVPGGQRRRGGGDADAGAPVATNTILNHPDRYYGKPLTVSAGVEQVLSATAFLVDQRKAAGDKGVVAIGQPILVIAPTLATPLDQAQYLLLKGQLARFDAATMGQLVPGYRLDLTPALTARYQGQPVLLATSVLDSTYHELAKKPGS
jgi:hypothetical protein